jgi:hypothetical protein
MQMADKETSEDHISIEQRLLRIENLVRFLVGALANANLGLHKDGEGGFYYVEGH